MKKKNHLTNKDLKDWQNFINDKNQVQDKDASSIHSEKIKKKIKFDLHGLTLNQANEIVKDVIIDCSKKKIKEILFITGKGLHSNDTDVYKSAKLNKLRYSVPDFISTSSDISKLVLSVTTPSEKEGGKGAIIVKLRNL